MAVVPVFYLAFIVVPLAACGSDAPLIKLDLILPKDHDPFAGVEVLRLSATGPPSMEPVIVEAPNVSKGEVRLPPIPFGDDRVIKIEGLDNERLVIARGQTDPFEVSSDGPQRVTIHFARCPNRLFRDADSDKHGDPNREKYLCSIPPGFVANDTDCDDSDPEVHRGQTEFFSRSSTGTRRYDFNCDGKEEQKLDRLVSCMWVPPACTGEGWEGSVPACGQSGTFVTCVKKSDCIKDITQSMVQTCR